MVIHYFSDYTGQREEIWNSMFGIFSHQESLRIFISNLYNFFTQVQLLHFVT